MVDGWRRANAPRSRTRGRAGEGARLAELFDLGAKRSCQGWSDQRRRWVSMPREAMLSQKHGRNGAPPRGEMVITGLQF